MRNKSAILAALLLVQGCMAAVIKLDCGRSNSDEVILSTVATMVRASCPPNCKAAGSVYGSSIYTSDSAICRAAIHAGVITNAKGGTFTLYYAKGRTSYTGSTRNGVTSSTYLAPWRSSFKFVGPALTPYVDCDKHNGFRDVVGVGQGVVYNRTKLTLSCPGGCLAAGGNIYGTGAYTADSRICLSAIHAGVLKPTGGLVTIIDFPGLQSYRGSAANGVVSKDWGSFGHSFRFRAVTELKCGSTNSQNLLVNATVPTAYATCPSNCFDAGGDIYGTNSGYKSTSRICLAAVHAGVLTSNGGEVIVRYVKGPSSYKGTTSNFVTSKAAATSPNAFRFI